MNKDDEIQKVILGCMMDICYEACSQQDNEDVNLDYLRKDIQKKICPDVELIFNDDYTISMNFTMNQVLVESILQDYTNFLLNQNIINDNIDSNEIINLFIDNKNIWDNTIK